MKILELEIDGELTTHSLPQNWEEITIKQFIDISAMNEKELTDTQKAIELVKILTNIDDDQVELLDIISFNQIIGLLSFILTAPEFKDELADSIEVEGQEFFLKKDFNKLNVGEVIAIELINKRADNDYLNVLPDFLCVLLRKKREDGKLENFKEEFMLRRDMFESLPVYKFINIFSFFLNGKEGFPKSTKTSSKKTTKRTEKTKK